MKRYIRSASENEDVVYFRDWAKMKYGEDFNPSDLSDDEYYELEDWYREEIPSARREKNYR